LNNFVCDVNVVRKELRDRRTEHTKLAYTGTSNVGYSSPHLRWDFSLWCL